MSPATDTPASGHALAALLRRVPTSTARVVLHDLGLDRVVMEGLRPLVGSPGPVAGPARTVRFLPRREDVPSPPQPGLNRHLVDRLGSGEVLVIDAFGHRHSAVLGDMLATRAVHRGVAGVVADGVVRDLAGLEALKLPVFARGTHPAPNSYELLPWDADVPIQCGGVLVQPGDWILADVDSVLVIPAARAEEVAARGVATVEEEEFCQKLLELGFPLDDAYPLPVSRRPDLVRYQQTGSLPARNL